MRSLAAWAGVVFLFVGSAIAAEGGAVTVHKRWRAEDSTQRWIVKESAEAWQPNETAIIVCDMWDSHHCLNAVRRCVEVAPRMNEVLKSARGKGMLIIHAP